MQLLPGHALTVENGQVACLSAIGTCTTRSTGAIRRAGSASGWRIAATDSIQRTSAIGRAGRRLHLGRHRFKPDRHPGWSRDAAAGSIGFHGKFTEFPGYDESRYAEAACRDRRHRAASRSKSRPPTSAINIGKVIYHLDSRSAGPGSFPQYMVSKLAAETRQSRARRPRRRRDLRRLCALSDRLSRAVAEGRDRRHIHERQFRRHAGIDHSASDGAAGIQAADPPAVLQGTVRSAGRALFPPDRPFCRHGRRSGLDRARSALACSSASRRSSIPNATCARKPISTR